MGLFANLKDKGTMDGGRRYFKPGTYEVEVNRVLKKEGGFKGDSFIVEVNVLESSNEEIEEGATLAWIVKKAWPSFEESVARFLRKAQYAYALQNGIDPGVDSWEKTPIDEKSANAIVGEENPLAGVGLKARAYNTKTEKGGDFTVVQWGVPE